MNSIRYWLLAILVLSFYDVIKVESQIVSVHKTQHTNMGMSRRIFSSLLIDAPHLAVPPGTVKTNRTDDKHHIVERSVGVHSVLNERLKNGDGGFNRNVTRNVTRSEAQEIQKARITVISACSLSVISTTIFIAFVYCRERSKRVTKVGIVDGETVRKIAIATKTTTTFS